MSPTGALMEVPCGQCFGCRLEYSRRWALRGMHEASMHARNSFLTLTFAVDPISLDVRHLQLFFKQLRNRGLSVRQYSCGEYGDELGRPHYHVLLFGEDFSLDRWHFYTNDQGFPIFRSPTLEKCWPHGHSEIGDVTFESASYVAGYVQKKLKGKPDQALLCEDGLLPHYTRIDPDTGEIHFVKPEFSVMSRGGRGGKGGIGKGYLEKFRKEILRDDSVLSRGRLVKPPRYYDELNKVAAPDRLEEVKAERVKVARERASDSTPERLEVRERCARARHSLKWRRRYET